MRRVGGGEGLTDIAHQILPLFPVSRFPFTRRPWELQCIHKTVHTQGGV